MPERLDGCRVAILVTDGFEQVEMTEPRQALEQAGAKADLIAPQKKDVQGMNHDEKAKKFPVDLDLASVSVDEYDALLLPGGVANPDKLRTIQQAVEFVKGSLPPASPLQRFATDRGCWWNRAWSRITV